MTVFVNVHFGHSVYILRQKLCVLPLLLLIKLHFHPKLHRTFRSFRKYRLPNLMCVPVSYVFFFALFLHVFFLAFLFFSCVCLICTDSYTESLNVNIQGFWFELRTRIKIHMYTSTFESQVDYFGDAVELSIHSVNKHTHTHNLKWKHNPLILSLFFSVTVSLFHGFMYSFHVFNQFAWFDVTYTVNVNESCVLGHWKGVHREIICTPHTKTHSHSHTYAEAIHYHDTMMLLVLLFICDLFEIWPFSQNFRNVRFTAFDFRPVNLI